MGKVNVKQKAKAAAAKRRKEENEAPLKNPFDLRPAEAQQQTPQNVPTVEDFENKSVISFKALHGVTKSKKEKLKLRRKLWQEKIELCKAKKTTTSKTKKTPAGKGALDGEKGFQLLLDSLPSVKDRVNELRASKASFSTTAPATGGTKSQPKRKTEKQRMREDLRNIDTFNQVLRHPEFQKNPMDTILEHLKNKQEMEKDGRLNEEETGAAPKKKNRNRRRKREGKRAEKME